MDSKESSHRISICEQEYSDCHAILTQLKSVEISVSNNEDFNIKEEHEIVDLEEDIEEKEVNHPKKETSSTSFIHLEGEKENLIANHGKILNRTTSEMEPTSPPVSKWNCSCNCPSNCLIL